LKLQIESIFYIIHIC